MKNNILIIFFIFNLLNEKQVLCKEINHKVSEALAQKLVAEGVRGSGTKAAQMSFDYQGDDSQISPPFYAYDLLGYGNGSLGFFAVNPWTGTCGISGIARR